MVIDLYYESENKEACQKFYRSETGILFIVTRDGLHTTSDEYWREPRFLVRAERFKLHEKQQSTE